MLGASIPTETLAIADFTSQRGTTPDAVALTASVRVAVGDPAAVVIPRGAAAWSVKKAKPWTAPDVSAVQSAIDTAPTLTAQIAAQRTVDAWPIEYKALVLALIDALNVVRSKLPTPLPAITPAQAIQAIRDKAGAL